MGKPHSDSIVILGCVAGIFVVGVLCLIWPRGMQRVSIWWADLGMYPFPGLPRWRYYVWLLRLIGLFFIGVTAFLLSGVLGSFFG